MEINHPEPEEYNITHSGHRTVVGRCSKYIHVQAQPVRILLEIDK